MVLNRLQYLEHYLGCIDFVISGRKGSISEDKQLVKDYDPAFYSVLEKHLKNVDHRVRTETVLLLTALKERQAMAEIKRLRTEDNEKVSSACLAYLNSLGEADDCIPDTIDILKHTRDQSFKKAAMRMKSIGRTEDIPELRTIYGQIDGDMREAIKEALSSIIDRDASLKGKKALLLSVPVYPNEKSFEKFADSSTVYIDIRYRDSVCPRSEIPVSTYNNVAVALKKIQTRLFNEKDNLRYYEPDKKQTYDELSSLLSWAAEDLSGKKVIFEARKVQVHDCSACGNRMALSNDAWVCPECGLKEK